MLIQDIKPAAKGDTQAMIVELFKRGVTIEQIFGVYYELEAIADARHDEIFGDDEAGQHGQLTVADALLAGVVARDINPKPF